MSIMTSRARTAAGGFEQVAGLDGAEGDRDGARAPLSPGTAPVSVSTPEGRSTATTGTSRPRQRGRRGRPRRRAVRAGRRCRGCRRARGRRGRVSAGAAGGRSGGRRRRSSAARPSACGVAEHADRVDPDAAAGQPGAGPQGVAAVVARADQDQDPRAVHAAGAASQLPASTAASPAAARCISAPSGTSCMAVASRRRTCSTVKACTPATLSSPCRGSADPTASARRSARQRSALADHDGGGDAGVVGQADVDGHDARGRGPGGDGSADDERGRPRSSVTISASCQTSPAARRAPWPAPPWPRTGRPARPRAVPPRPA